MTPERLAEIRDRVTYNPEDWPITIELVAHIDTLTAEIDRLKGEVERLKRLNTSLVYGHDIFKLAALRVESTLRAQRDALVTAGEKVKGLLKEVKRGEDELFVELDKQKRAGNWKVINRGGIALSEASDALSAAVTQAKGEK